MKPIDVLVERGGDPEAVAARLRAVPGVVGATPGLAGRAERVRRGVPGDRRRRARHPGDHRPLERGARRDRRDRDRASPPSTATSSTPCPAGCRTCWRSCSILTLLLLIRAFRSIVLPLKAVLLNLVSLAAAFGVVVLVFQLGHGSALWDVPATQSDDRRGSR